MNTNIINQINQSGYKAYFAITGGGASFLGNYLSVSGGSNFVLGANIPYSSFEFHKFVNKPTNKPLDYKYCNEEAARKLAMASFLRCLEAGIEEDKALGIGVTCSLAKTNEREEREHKAFICIHSDKQTILRNVSFAPQNYTNNQRKYQENIVVENIFDVLTCVLNIRNSDFSAFFDVGYSQKIGYKQYFMIDSSSEDTAVFFPGSFNLIHNGHEEMIKIAKKITGFQPILEISIVNVDKDRIDWIDLDNRRKNILNHPCIITNCATFEEKIKYIRRNYSSKKLVFMMGVDVWNRIWNEKKNVFSILNKQYSIWLELGIKFLVFPRNKEFIKTHTGFSTIPIWKLIHEKNCELNSFNNPISSTEIRKRMVDKV